MLAASLGDQRARDVASSRPHPPSARRLAGESI
jgi:hypothetical protein